MNHHTVNKFTVFCLLWITKSDCTSLAKSEPASNNCILTTDQKLLSVLPGIGWDNLVNQERGPVIHREQYTKCRRSIDGQFLIPDDIIVEPIKHSQIKLSSEVYESITQYHSLTAMSINAAVQSGFGALKIDGDFSFEKETIREKVSQSKGLMVQSEIRHNRYVIRQTPDSKLDPHLKGRLLDIASHLETGNVSLALIEQFDEGQISSGDNHSAEMDKQTFLALREAMKAFYLADLIIRDFGTHSISTINVGAILAKIDTLDKSSLKTQTEDRWKLAATATSSFADVLSVKAGASGGRNESLLQNYARHLTYSEIISYGGPILHASDLKFDNWEKNLEDNLVAIDRSGMPIYEMISGRSMPELSSEMVIRLSTTLKSAVKRYYKANTVVGCLNPSSVHYDSEANMASPDCDNEDAQGKVGNLPLGGVYQTCTGPKDLCKTETIQNSATGDLTCPKGFISVQLLPEQVRSCYDNCNTVSSATDVHCASKCAITKSYWCSLDPNKASNDTDNGFLFGGLYTDKEVNPMTKQFSCPEYYWPVTFGRRMRVCLSTDMELGGKYALPFGGFYSCFAGNPLISVFQIDDSKNSSQVAQRRKSMRSWMQAQIQRSRVTSSNKNNGKVTRSYVDTSQNDFSYLFASLWTKQCPRGYTAHLAAMEDVCQVNYCVKANILKNKRRRQLKRPPFVLPLEQQPELVRAIQADMLIEDKLTVKDAEGNVMERRKGEWVTAIDTSSKGQPQKVVTATLGVLIPIIAVLLGAISVLSVYFRHVQRSQTQTISN